MPIEYSSRETMWTPSPSPEPTEPPPEPTEPPPAPWPTVRYISPILRSLGLFSTPGVSPADLELLRRFPLPPANNRS